MSEETWLAARLIPTSGINGAEEQERRATSALLAVMSSVREFGRVLTQSVGAPAGVVQTFIEVPFNSETSNSFRTASSASPGGSASGPRSWR
ncbi:hypothetical protein AB0I92_09070 [Micromonospora chalcea]|uniref:hypothetical protein n=1 Tax=Micromonospora chalcea TaxID=1874 RepID=UPI0033C9FE82